jgi:hypothetical protein
MATLMLNGDELMEPFTHAILIPAVLAEKLLQGARRDVCVECYRLHALFREFRKLTSNLHAQVCARVLAIKAVVEEINVLGELRLQPTNLLDIHVLPSRSPWQDTVSSRTGIRASST